MATNGPVSPESATEVNPLKVAAQTKADETNKARTGKGTRVRVGATRGKGSQVISYEVFDESQPDTLPKSVAEFMELTKVSDEASIVSILIDGYNAQSYQTASDPIAEYVNPVWPDEVQKSFRLVVRNFASAAGISLEAAVEAIKPGIDKVHGKQ